VQNRLTGVINININHAICLLNLQHHSWLAMLHHGPSAWQLSASAGNGGPSSWLYHCSLNVVLVLPAGYISAELFVPASGRLLLSDWQSAFGLLLAESQYSSRIEEMAVEMFSEMKSNRNEETVTTRKRSDGKSPALEASNLKRRASRHHLRINGRHDAGVAYAATSAAAK